MWWLAAVCTWLTGAEPSAPTTNVVYWDAPAECPDQEYVTAAIVEQSDVQTLQSLGHDTQVRMTARADGSGGWYVTIVVEASVGTSTRDLGPAPNCRDAVDAAAIVVAMALASNRGEPGSSQPASASTRVATESASTTNLAEGQPSQDQPQPAPGSGDAVTVQTAAEVANMDKPPPAAAGQAGPLAPKRGTALRGGVGATGTISVGDLPRLGGAGQLHGLLRSRRFRLEIGAGFAAGLPVTVDQGNFRLRRWHTRLAVGAMFPVTPTIEVGAMGAAEAGQTLVSTQGLRHNNSYRYPWAVAAAGPWVGFALARNLALRLGLELRVPITRRAYQVLGHGTVHQTAPVAGAFSAGIEGIFP